MNNKKNEAAQNEKEFMKIVIVGHVDHGKSTLIGRLFYDTNSLPEGVMDEVKKTCEMLGREVEFAYVLDSLQEEREQNVTIDTTQIFFTTTKRGYVIIDAPGHKEFVKNMITGASQAEAAVLIVAAKEGVQEQTKRHAYILGMLGMKKVIVVINKMDVVDYKKERFEEVKNDIASFLSTIGIKPQQIIPISASKGDNIANKSENMNWYIGPTILEMLDSFKVKEELTQKPLRFPIQDVYKIGDKRILVGKIESGKISEGENISFYPSGKTSKIKSIEKFMENKTSAHAGECIGVTIEDPLFIEGGEILASKDNAPKTTSEFKAKIFWMSKDPLIKNEKIILKCATQEAGCRINIHKKFNSSSLEMIEENALKLEDNEVGEAIITTDKPIVIENFNDVEELGRFVLVKGYDVAAGGIITE